MWFSFHNHSTYPCYLMKFIFCLGKWTCGNFITAAIIKTLTKWNKWLTQKNKNFRAPEFKQKLWNKFKTPDLTTQPNTITKQQLVSNNLRFQFQNPDFHPVSKTNFSQVSKTDSFEQKKIILKTEKALFWSTLIGPMACIAGPIIIFSCMKGDEKKRKKQFLRSRFKIAIKNRGNYEISRRFGKYSLHFHAIKYYLGCSPIFPAPIFISASVGSRRSCVFGRFCSGFKT